MLRNIFLPLSAVSMTSAEQHANRWWHCSLVKCVQEAQPASAGVSAPMSMEPDLAARATTGAVAEGLKAKSALPNFGERSEQISIHLLSWLGIAANACLCLQTPQGHGAVKFCHDTAVCN